MLTGHPRHAVGHMKLTGQRVGPGAQHAAPGMQARTTAPLRILNELPAGSTVFGDGWAAATGQFRREAEHGVPLGAQRQPVEGLRSFDVGFAQERRGAPVAFSVAAVTHHREA